MAEVRGHVAKHTETASTITRNLALAGVAVVWIFRETSGGRTSVPWSLWAVLVLLCVGLVLDLAQYLLLAYRWHRFQRTNERDGATEDEEFRVDPALTAPGFGLFVSKTIAVLLGVAWLIGFFAVGLVTGTLPGAKD